LLLALEQRLARIGERLTAEKAAALLADGFIEFGASGKIWTKADVVAAMAVWEPASATIEDFSVRELGSSLCLVTYKFVEAGNANRSSLRSSLWRYSGKAWEMVFHQGTTIK